MSSRESVLNHGESDLIIDTDAGIDDAQALLLALAHSSVAAITTVHGNVPLEQATANVAKLLVAFNRTSVPFYRGADKPLIGIPYSAGHIHGDDGLGGSHLSDVALAAQPEPAPEQLVRMIQARPNFYTVVCLGPLTNIALALRLAPEIATLVKRLIFIGGSLAGKGNITVSAEFNIFCDPEAAVEVLAQLPESVMVSWDTILKHAVPWSWMDEWMNVQTPQGKLMQQITAMFYKFYEPENSAYETDGYAFGDPLAIAVALWPEIVLKDTLRWSTVELEGKYTRGMSVIEWRVAEKLTPDSHPILNKPQTRIVLDLDVELLQQKMMSALTVTL